MGPASMETHAPKCRRPYSPIEFYEFVIIKDEMEWDSSIENLCARYCDESQVRCALHSKQYFHYKKLLSWFQLPIIVLSAASASVQFLSKQFPMYESDIITGTATLSIVVSIISSVMTYLKIGENKSKNEVAEMGWQSFYNTVSHQLSLKREHREKASEFLTEVKQSYERLFELSPMVQKSFILEVKKEVAKKKSQTFCSPHYLNGYHATEIYKSDDEYEENSSVGSRVLVQEV